VCQEATSRLALLHLTGYYLYNLQGNCVGNAERQPFGCLDGISFLSAFDKVAYCIENAG